MIFFTCTLGLLASNMSKKVGIDFLQVYTWFAGL